MFCVFFCRKNIYKFHSTFEFVNKNGRRKKSAEMRNRVIMKKGKC